MNTSQVLERGIFYFFMVHFYTFLLGLPDMVYSLWLLICKSFNFIG